LIGGQQTAPPKQSLDGPVGRCDYHAGNRLKLWKLCE